MRHREYWVLEDGKPVPVKDVIAWGRWFEDPRNRIVERSYLSRDGELLPTQEDDALSEPPGTYAAVSTVFLGIAHSFGWASGEETTPILFETMVYLTDGSMRGPHGREYKDEFLDPEWRYKTAEAARMNHVRIADQVQGWLRAGRDLRGIAADEWIDQ